MSEVNPTTIHEELLEDFLKSNWQLVTQIIEGIAPSSTLKPGQFVPLAVDGRDVGMQDRLVSQNTAADINEFKYMLLEVFQDKQDRDGINPEDRVEIIQEYPPLELATETISYRLISRDVGTTSQGKQMNKRRQEWRPRVREVVWDPDKPNKKLYILGQWYDNVIELSVWARTSKVADKRAIWLEKLMDDYAWFFKYRGISAVRFEGRLADRFEEIEGNHLQCRPLRYFVRTERITHLSTYTLADILMRIRTTNE